MTPEERAEAITRNWKSIEVGCTPLSSQVALTSCHIGGDMVAVVTEQIAAAIREAVAEQRERCAKVAEGWKGRRLVGECDDQRISNAFGRGVDMAAYYIAAAIRREPTT